MVREVEVVRVGVGEVGNERAVERPDAVDHDGGIGMFAAIALDGVPGMPHDSASSGGMFMPRSTGQSSSWTYFAASLAHAKLELGNNQRHQRATTQGDGHEHGSAAGHSEHVEEENADAR